MFEIGALLLFALCAVAALVLVVAAVARLLVGVETHTASASLAAGATALQIVASLLLGG